MNSEPAVDSKTRFSIVCDGTVAVKKLGCNSRRELIMCKSTRSKIIRIALAMLIMVCPISLSFGDSAYASDKSNHSQGPSVVEEKIGKRTYQVSRMYVHARPEQVWQILTDYENAHTIFPCVRKCKVLHDRGNVKEVEQQIKPTGVPGSFTYVLEITETPHRLQQWHRVRGDFSEVEGFWKLEPSEEGTNVTYASYCSGGLFLPQALIKHQFRVDNPNVMSALRHSAETSRQIASQGQTNFHKTP